MYFYICLSSKLINEECAKYSFGPKINKVQFIIFQFTAKTLTTLIWAVYWAWYNYWIYTGSYTCFDSNSSSIICELRDVSLAADSDSKLSSVSIPVAVATLWVFWNLASAWTNTK